MLNTVYIYIYCIYIYNIAIAALLRCSSVGFCFCRDVTVFFTFLNNMQKNAEDRIICEESVDAHWIDRKIDPSSYESVDAHWIDLPIYPYILSKDSF